MYSKDQDQLLITLVDIETAVDFEKSSPSDVFVKSKTKSLRLYQVVAVVLATVLLSVFATLKLAPLTQDAVISKEIQTFGNPIHSLFDKREPRKKKTKTVTINNNISTSTPIATQAAPTPIATGSSSRNIIFPLYIDPGENGVQWQAVLNQANLYPSVTFTIIINPNSGPGTGKARMKPDPDYAAGLNLLNSASNIQVIGYVHQSYGARAYADVMADVAVWATWGNTNMYGSSISGIFFDEGPSDDSQTLINYVKKVNTATKAMSGFGGPAFVVQNPGTLPVAAYFTDDMNCDVSVILEDTYKTYTGASKNFNGQASALQTSISAFCFIFTSFPTMSLAQMKAALTPMVKQAGYIFITNLSGDNMYSMIGSNWSLFVQSMASI